MITQFVTTSLHPVWLHLFVVVFEWDIHGIGLAQTLSSSILLTSTVVYAHFIEDFKDALFLPDKSVWAEWREYFRLGVPTAAIFCAQYYSWQFLTIISGNLSVEAQANMMITL